MVFLVCLLSYLEGVTLCVASIPYPLSDIGPIVLASAYGISTSGV